MLVQRKSESTSLHDVDDTRIKRACINRLNPVAVNLARLSIWIHTFVPGLPVSMLQRNLVVGNTLAGLVRISEIEDKSMVSMLPVRFQTVEPALPARPRSWRSLLGTVILAGALGAGITVGHAQEWPTRFVKVVVPYGPGGISDVLGRITADRLSMIFGQRFIVETHPGANGAIGTEYAVRSPADGYTLYEAGGAEFSVVPLMQKLEKLGCSKSVVGLVVPSGYSFNLDGTNIYLTMAALFVAQALNIELTLRQQLTVLFVAMLTSKGASGVTGAGFITLAATLTVVPSIPVAGLALILGIDRFMSEARSLTNFIGNGVAAIVVSHWEKELDRKKLAQQLS